MDPPAGLVAFVMRSENRLVALCRVAEGPTTRSTLQETTGIPRATLSRILADFRERDLLDREGRTYVPTVLGVRLARELERVFAAVEEATALQTVATWLPRRDLDVALADLEDVRITLPQIADPMAPVRRAAAVVGEADTVRGFCYSVLHVPILTETAAVVREGRTFEGVVARAVLDVIAADAELRTAVEALAGSGRASLWIYDGPIGPQFIVADEVVAFLATSGEGTIQGLVETRDDRLRPWADRTFEAYRSAADRVDPDNVAEILTP